MKLQRRRRAISPIVASLLLIAISVAAGIIVYVFTTGLSGSLTGGGGTQVTQQLQLQAYTFNPVGGLGTGQVILFFLKNTGTSSLTISNVYVDGSQLVEWTVTAGNYNQYVMVPATTQSCFAAVAASTFSASALASTNNVANLGTGTSSACTGGPTACNTASTFCLNMGGAVAEKLTLTVGDTNEFIVGLNAGSIATAGSGHTVKVITTSGGQYVFNVIAGKTG